jgi:nucleoside 2-deoxyribosyltransferase
MNIYLAGPLFTLAERRFNAALADRIVGHSPALSVFLPQTCDADLLGLPDFSQRIYARLMEAIHNADAVVALLDGSAVDSGTCVEIGYAKALGKKIVGVHTDCRGSESLSPVAVGLCDHMVSQAGNTCSIDGLAAEIVAQMNLTVEGAEE